MGKCIPIPTCKQKVKVLNKTQILKRLKDLDALWQGGEYFKD